MCVIIIKIKKTLCIVLHRYTLGVIMLTSRALAKLDLKSWWCELSVQVESAKTC